MMKKLFLISFGLCVALVNASASVKRKQPLPNGAGPITLVCNTTLVANIPYGSAVTATGPNTGGMATFAIPNTGWSATMHVYYSADGINGTQVPDALVNNLTTGVAGTGVISGGADLYQAPVFGGFVYVAPSAYTSGTINITNLTVVSAGTQQLTALQAIQGLLTGKLKTGKPLTLLGASAGATNGVISSGAHFTTRLIGQNANATTYYLMIFDSSTLPTNGTTPIAQVMVSFGIPSAPTENTRDFGVDWIPNNTALYYAWSSTADQLTLASSGTGLGFEIYGN